MTVSQLAFGMYQPASLAPHDSTAVVHLTCPSPARLSLAGGPDRQLRGAKGALHYGLFLDPARSQPWGDGTRGTSTLTLPAGRSSATIYARVPSRQNLPPGNYSDLVLIIAQF
jgi:spore coat protein U-like protein